MITFIRIEIRDIGRVIDHIEKQWSTLKSDESYVMQQGWIDDLMSQIYEVKRIDEGYIVKYGAGNRKYSVTFRKLT